MNPRIGNALWAELHNYTGRYPDIPEWYNRNFAIDWLERFAKRVELSSCGDCAAHWRELVLHNPANLDSRDEFLLWAIRMHDLVNARLGKPMWADKN